MDVAIWRKRSRASLEWVAKVATTAGMAIANSSIMKILAFSFMAISLLGCNDQVSFENEGTLCMFAADPDPFITESPQDFTPGAPVELLVVMEPCVSGSCTSDIVASCEATVSGNQITVTSSGSYREDSGLVKACTDDCRVVSATCSTASLPAGSYTVFHGEDVLPLDVPASLDSAPCTSSSLF